MKIKEEVRQKLLKSDFGIPEKCRCGSNMLFIRSIYDGSCNRKIGVWMCPQSHEKRYSLRPNVPKSFRLTCRKDNMQHIMFFYSEKEAEIYAKALLNLESKYCFELFNTVEKKLVKCRHWRYDIKYKK